MFLYTNKKKLTQWKMLTIKERETINWWIKVSKKEVINEIRRLVKGEYLLFKRIERKRM